jgi:hypothetical protein
MRIALTLSFAVAACGPSGGGFTRDSSRLFACGDTPAPSLFEHALCICDDFDEVGDVHVGRGRDPASIGVNGVSRSVTHTSIDGDWIAHGGLEAAAAIEITGDLTSAKSVDWVGLLEIGGDLSVGGHLTGVGDLRVGGDVAVAGRRSTIGIERIGGVGAYQGAAPPCNCDPSTFLDVARIVELAKTDNDNAARDIDEAKIFAVGDVALELDTGRYFFRDVTTIGRSRLTIAGAVSIFLDGDLLAIGDDHIEILDGASLDLYVSGSVGTVGHVRFGNEADPSAFRLYVGGTKPMELAVGLTSISGTIYAPEAYVGWVGDTHVDGAVFARELDGVGRLDVSYTRPTAVDVPPGECPEPVEPAEPNDDPAEEPLEPEV